MIVRPQEAPTPKKYDRNRAREVLYKKKRREKVETRQISLLLSAAGSPGLMIEKLFLTRALGASFWATVERKRKKI